MAYMFYFIHECTPSLPPSHVNIEVRGPVEMKCNTFGKWCPLRKRLNFDCFIYITHALINPFCFEFYSLFALFSVCARLSNGFQVYNYLCTIPNFFSYLKSKNRRSKKKKNDAALKCHSIWNCVFYIIESF